MHHGPCAAKQFSVDRAFVNAESMFGVTEDSAARRVGGANRSVFLGESRCGSSEMCLECLRAKSFFGSVDCGGTVKRDTRRRSIKSWIFAVFPPAGHTMCLGKIQRELVFDFDLFFGPRPLRKHCERSRRKSTTHHTQPSRSFSFVGGYPNVLQKLAKGHCQWHESTRSARDEN